MITLDAVRAAMLSADPYTELDRLVRNELGAGRTTDQITDDFRPILGEALATSGLTREGKESLLSTLDALTGNCHPDQWYDDPPNNTLPTEEEIAKLPRWARVAFAARCARRVLGLLPELCPLIAQDDLQTVGKSVGHAEEVASVAELDPRVNTVFGLGAVDAAHHVAAIAQSRNEVAGATIALSAAAAMYAAYTDNSARQTQAAVNNAEFAASKLAPPVPIASAIRRDFDHLVSRAEAYHWDDETPVPPEVFGPLWPEGPPKGWPPATDVAPRAELAVEMFARERATEQMIEDDIVNLFNALNRYHVARSGVRLTLDQFRSLLPALVPAET